jgi:hypothetical protein
MSSQSTRASAAADGVTEVLGGDDGREGGSLRANRVGDGVTGEVLPEVARCLLVKGVDCGKPSDDVGFTWGRLAKATSALQMIEIKKVAKVVWEGRVVVYRTNARAYTGMSACNDTIDG